jgi:homoserine kinase
MSGEGNMWRLRLPATSANLGSGFDAVAIALDFALEIEAGSAEVFSIAATGRNAESCSRLEGNLILETYKQILQANERPVVPLALQVANGIPLAMGCGSSAAALLAGISLAVHFGQLDWSAERVLDEAYAREGHPDNVAACWLGGFVAAACQDGHVKVAQVKPPEDWRAIVVCPAASLATSKARAVLPACYTLKDVVANLQSVSVLGLAFQQARGDLLGLAMKDRIHQPYRENICPLLPLLLPLVGSNGILGAALSGAGPAVLIVVDKGSNLAAASSAIEKAIFGRVQAEQVVSRLSTAGAKQMIENIAR